MAFGGGGGWSGSENKNTNYSSSSSSVVLSDAILMMGGGASRSDPLIVVGIDARETNEMPPRPSLIKPLAEVHTSSFHVSMCVCERDTH